ncbi:hypothetical protein IKG60_01100 [Candidatus Saccharibacteria bacterium]|nr:hypothetical protein [Candidatus Saccharibacteria bacterium]
MKTRRSSENRNKALVWVLVGLCAVAVVLAIVIATVVTRSSESTNTESNEAQERAFELTSELEERMLTEASFNPPQAYEEYIKVFNEAEGSYQLFVGVELAKFTCETLEECDWAILILNEVSPGGDWEEQSAYFGEMIKLHQAVGDEEQVYYYKDLLDSLSWEEDETE